MKTRLCLLLFLALLPPLAHTQAKPAGDLVAKILTTRELTDQADVVAVGKVSALTSDWNADRTRIHTRVRIDVREFLKGGGPDQSLTVLTAGGEVGDVGEIYSGMARFRSNEEVVVFARTKRAQDHELVGGEQGKVHVSEDMATGVKTVPRGIRLDDFRSEVKSAAQADRPEEKKP